MDLVALIWLMVVTQKQTEPRFEEGREARVCGAVVSYRTSSRCDVTLVVADAQQQFEVLIPAAVGSASMRPWQMAGAQVCATGRVTLRGAQSLPSHRGRVFVNVTAANDVQVVAPSANADFGEDARLFCDTGLQAPQVLSERKPNYTSEARRAKVRGTVEMLAVVDVSGAVRDVRISQPLHPQLDQEAIEALKQWRFKPALEAGKPVPVVVAVEMTFTTR